MEVVKDVPQTIEEKNAEIYAEICEFNEEEFNEFLTPEYCASRAIHVLKASSAYLDGATGEGIKIAIIDTGVDVNNTNFNQDKIEVIDVSHTPLVEEHGTRVASIALGIKDQLTIHDEYDGISM